MIQDDLPFALARIGEVLEQHSVRYVVIGGMSGMFHGMVDYRTKEPADVLLSDAAVRADVDDLDALVVVSEVVDPFGDVSTSKRPEVVAAAEYGVFRLGRRQVPSRVTHKWVLPIQDSSRRLAA